MALYYNKDAKGRGSADRRGSSQGGAFVAELVQALEAVTAPARARSARTTVRRRAGRARYDREAIDPILDEGLVGHVAFALDGHPYAIPMLYAREGDEIYLHGSPLSRLLGGVADGIPICFTVTLIDGLVLARSAFH